MPNFNNKFAMRCTEDQWNEPMESGEKLQGLLEKAGYDCSEIDFKGNNYIVTSTGKIGEPDKIYTWEFVSPTYLTFEEWNPKLFYALASQIVGRGIHVGDFFKSVKTGEIMQCDDLKGNYIMSKYATGKHHAFTKHQALKCTYEELIEYYNGKVKESPLVTVKPEALERRKKELELKGILDETEALLHKHGLITPIIEGAKARKKPTPKAIDRVRPGLEPVIDRKNKVWVVGDLTDELVTKALLGKPEPVIVNGLAIPKMDMINVDPYLNQIQQHFAPSNLKATSEHIRKLRKEMEMEEYFPEHLAEKPMTVEEAFKPNFNQPMTFTEILKAFAEDKMVYHGTINDKGISCVAKRITMVSKSRVTFFTEEAKFENIFCSEEKFLLHALTVIKARKPEYI